MRNRFFIRLAIPSVLILGMSLTYLWRGAGVSAQQRAVDHSKQLPRTPWGAPDITGIWGLGYVFTGMERPEALKDKPFLTDAEVAALEKAQRESGGDGT